MLHDFDAAGIIIKDTLENDTRRYQLQRTAERHRSRAAATTTSTTCRPGGLRLQASATTASNRRVSSDAAIDFLSDQRVELNAMTSRQLVDFVERKLNEHGVAKVIPDARHAGRHLSDVCRQRATVGKIRGTRG